MPALIVTITLLAFLHGATHIGRESKYLKTEWHQDKDSITQVMLKTTGKVDKKRRKELLIELQRPRLVRLGYIKDSTNINIEPPL